MRFKPLDVLSNTILGSLIQKTGSLLIDLQGLKQPPEFFEGENFVWSLDLQNKPTLLILIKSEFTKGNVKIWWNGKYFDDFEVLSNLNISAKEELAFFVSLENLVYGEINGLIRQRDLNRLRDQND